MPNLQFNKKYTIIFIIMLQLIGINFAVSSEVISDKIFVDDDADISWYDQYHVKTIQEALNNVSFGGTIIVYNGTYRENITITKSLTLLGESKENTIIDGENKGDVIRVEIDDATISCITISNATTDDIWERWGIKIRKGLYPSYPLKNFSISDCIITKGKGGILLNNVSNCQISNCTIEHNTGSGLSIRQQSNNILVNNCSFSNSGEIVDEGVVTPGGVQIDGGDSVCNGITIKNSVVNSNIGIGLQFIKAVNVTVETVNILRNSWMGLYINKNVQKIVFQNSDISNNGYHGVYIVDETDQRGSTQTIQDVQLINNTIQNNSYDITQGPGGIMIYNCIDAIKIKHNDIVANKGHGIYCSQSRNNIFIENNLLNNDKNAFFSHYSYWNQWDGNYWDDWRGIGPKCISGKLGSFLPWFNFDWHPQANKI